MSAAAIMMVRDEADIIDATLAHLEWHVDRVYVRDNRSRDGTREILDLHAETGFVVVEDDPEIGYWQSAKMTEMAFQAWERGFAWVVPIDADELWETPDGSRLRDWLRRQPPDVQVAEAALFNMLPTEWDGDEPEPTKRIQWMQPEPAPLPKVACRTAASLTIHAGNHSASYGRGPAGRARGLRIRHYSWRSEDQYVRKIRNGLEAYAATDLPPEIGEHWRMWEGHDDDAIREHFRRWFVLEAGSASAQAVVRDPYRPPWEVPSAA